MAFIVYEVVCLTTGKSYIGVTKRSIKSRWKGHCDKAAVGIKDHGCPALSAAIRKYGKDQFTITAIASAFSEEGLLASERAIIEQNKTKSPLGYNISDGGAGCLNPTQETRDKKRRALLGKKHTPEFIEKRVAPLRGRKIDRALVERRIGKQRGVKRYSWGKHTAESKAKMSASIKAAIAARGGKRYTVPFRRRRTRSSPNQLSLF